MYYVLSETDIHITFRNYGNQALTSLDLTYDINGGTPATYNWTGNLASGAQETVTITNVSFTPMLIALEIQEHVVTWDASNPNGQVDQNTTNNSSVSKFSHKDMSGDVLQGIAAGNVNIDLLTDGYGSETSWEIVAEDGTILGSGGPYASNHSIQYMMLLFLETCVLNLSYMIHTVMECAVQTVLELVSN